MYVLSCSHPLLLPLNHNRSFGPEQDFHTQLQDRFVCKCVNLHKKVGKPVTCCCQGHNYWHRFSRTCEHLLLSTFTTLKTSWVVAMTNKKFFLNFLANFHKYPLLLEQTWIMAVINFISFPNYGSGGNYLLIKQKEKKSSTKENLCGVLKNGRVGPSIYKDGGRGIFRHARVHEFGGFKVMARCRSQ